MKRKKTARFPRLSIAAVHPRELLAFLEAIRSLPTFADELTTLLERTGRKRAMSAKEVAWRAAIGEVLAAARKAQCACGIGIRASGHAIGCWMPDLTYALESLDALLAKTPDKPE